MGDDEDRIDSVGRRSRLQDVVRLVRAVKGWLGLEGLMAVVNPEELEVAEGVIEAESVVT